MTTLDQLSRGRIAWNVVTSYKIEEALNFGYEELLDHDQRYDRADEYMELCYRCRKSSRVLVPSPPLSPPEAGPQ